MSASDRSRVREPPASVPSPRFSALVGMEERDLGAVAEGLCDERGRALEYELADGTVAGAEEVDAEVAEAIHDRVRMKVPACEGAGEEPRTVGSGAGAEVRPRGEVLAHERSERFGNVCGVPAEANAHAGITVVDDIGRKGDELDQRLGVEQQAHPSYAVGE